VLVNLDCRSVALTIDFETCSWRPLPVAASVSFAYEDELASLAGHPFAAWVEHRIPRWAAGEHVRTVSLGQSEPGFTVVPLARGVRYPKPRKPPAARLLS